MSPIAIEPSLFFIFLYIMLLSNLLSTIDGIHMNEITKNAFYEQRMMHITEMTPAMYQAF